jgi:zinc transport system substrate-binding protein
LKAARSTSCRSLVATLLLIACLLPAGCAACRRRSQPQREVAATVFPVYDLVRRVAGDRLTVRLILAPGLDPHEYEPRPQDVAGLSEAGLIFAVGLGLDPWAGTLARAAGAGEARVFELGPLMDPILAPQDVIRAEPMIDPHFWTDPVRARRAVDVIVGALDSLDPQGGPFYRDRGEALKRSLSALHGEISRTAETWRHRRLVTFHGSLFYFAERYGLQVVGVVQPVPGSEPTAQHVTALVSLLRAPEPPVLLIEPEMDAQLARSLARDTGVRLHEVDTLGGRSAGASYEELMRSITRTLDEALR